PILYDPETDPAELSDLRADPASASERGRLNERTRRWNRQHHNRTTVADSRFTGRKGGELAKGIIVGRWDDAELAEGRASDESGN
ncbi:MAG: phosphonate monoester hydrolase, partial [Pseudomonadota bacterium]